MIFVLLIFVFILWSSFRVLEPEKNHNCTLNEAYGKSIWFFYQLISKISDEFFLDGLIFSADSCPI